MCKKRCLIIAEAGVNHNGSIELAKKLVDAAVEAKADIVKFQTFKAYNIVTPLAEKASYQKEQTGSDEAQFEMLKKLELSYDDHLVLLEYCKEKGIEFLSTAFDLESVDLLYSLGIRLFKIPSGEITNLPYLRKIAKLSDIKIILSTGMSTLEDIRLALDVFLKNGITKNHISLLHCHTDYPTQMKDVHLKAMKTLGSTFSVDVGHSDHSLGIEVPIAAVALGACIIEKHFTLDKRMSGPDHAASLDPLELKQMVLAIRNIELALGELQKKPSPRELEIAKVARKSIVAAQEIKKGDVFTEKNITAKRPGTGVSPMRWDDLLGQTAKRYFKKDELIEL